MSVDKGEEFEARIARLLAAEGSFVRRRINLDAHFGERFTITDVDVLSFSFSATLELRRVAVECKTTEAKSAPSTGDRLLWAAGLRRLVQADAVAVAIAKRARDTERQLARRLDSAIMDIRDVDRREEILGLDGHSPYGPHDPALGRLRTEALAVSKQDDDIRRVYRFVISELWLESPVAVFKKALGASRLLTDRWSTRLPEAERRAVEWMFREAVIGAILALVRLASLGYRAPEDVLARDLYERFSEGVADFHALREVSKQIDRYLMSALPRAGIEPHRSVELLGAFEPTPPQYLEPLTELLERMARQPAAAARMAQLADSRFAVANGADGSVAGRLGRTDATSRLLRLVATFLESQIRLPGALLAPLGDEDADGTDEEAGGNTEADGSAAARPTSRATPLFD